MDITSDDFCGVSQEVDITGELDLEPTACNGYMEGTVTVSNTAGAPINYTRILQVRTEPTLVNSEFMTVYDYNNGVTPLVVLDYESTSDASSPHEVKFKFLWDGAALRCDVQAHLEVMIEVQFEATRPLLMSVTTAGANMLADTEMKEENMRMVATSGYIPAAAENTDTDSNSGVDSSNTPVASTPSNFFADNSTLTIVVGALLVLLTVAVVVVTTVVVRRRRVLKAATSATALPPSIRV